MSNYTNQGDQVIFEEIAEKLLTKVECWEKPFQEGFNDRLANQQCWPTKQDLKAKDVEFSAGRQGWSFQRGPGEEDGEDEWKNYLNNQVSNPYGNDLLFLIDLMLR